MSDTVNFSLPTSAFCKLIFGGSLGLEGGGGYLGNFHFSFQTQNRNDSCCLSDLLKITPHKEQFFCMCNCTYRFFTLMYYSSDVDRD